MASIIAGRVKFSDAISSMCVRCLSFSFSIAEKISGSSSESGFASSNEVDVVVADSELYIVKVNT